MVFESIQGIGLCLAAQHWGINSKVEGHIFANARHEQISLKVVTTVEYVFV